MLSVSDRHTRPGGGGRRIDHGGVGVNAEVADPSLDRPAGPLTDPLSAATDDWQLHAACKGRTSLFFGLAGERPERRVRREARARKVCSSCAVQWACRRSARANRENGFWGGESEEERAAAGYPPRSIARRSVQAAAQSPDGAPVQIRAAAC
jgi:WhiB family transcriptional regulator, redox-sensing transcriptional regulator